MLTSVVNVFVVDILVEMKDFKRNLMSKTIHWCYWCSNLISLYFGCNFIMPPQKKGGRAFRVYPVRVFVRFRLFVCIIQNHVRPITASCMVGFKKSFGTNNCQDNTILAYKTHVGRLKVKVTVGT